ncbi:hypothetical protein SLA2020_232340 [Shorea laevis]
MAKNELRLHNRAMTAEEPFERGKGKSLGPKYGIKKWLKKKELMFSNQRYNRQFNHGSLGKPSYSFYSESYTSPMPLIPPLDRWKSGPSRCHLTGIFVFSGYGKPHQRRS